MAMKYKVGDKVRVKKWEDLKSEYEVDEDGYICHGVVFNDEMGEYCGKELVIRYVGMDEYLCHGNNWLWQDWMFDEELSIEDVVENNTSLIEVLNRKVYRLKEVENSIKALKTKAKVSHSISHRLEGDMVTLTPNQAVIDFAVEELERERALLMSYLEKCTITVPNKEVQ